MLKLEDKFVAGKIRAWNFIDFLLAKDALELFAATGDLVKLLK